MDKLTWNLKGNIKDVMKIIKEVEQTYGDITVKEFIEKQLEATN